MSCVTRNKDLFLNNKVIQRSRHVSHASLHNIKTDDWKILFFYGNKTERLNAYCKCYQYQHSPSNFQNITRYSISIYYTIFCLNYQFLLKTYSAKFNTCCFFLTLNRGQASTKCLFVHIPSRNWVSKTWIIFANGSEICKRPGQNVGY